MPSALIVCKVVNPEKSVEHSMFHTCGTFCGTFYIVHYITNTLWNILMFYNRGTSWNILWQESWEPGQLARVLSSSETTPGPDQKV